MKKIIFMLVMCILLSVTGCGKSENLEDKACFDGIVLKTNEKSIVVKPIGGAQITSYNKIIVSKEVTSKHEVPEIEEGYQVRVFYDGDIEGTFPGKVKDVFAIYLVDMSGEIIE